LGSDAAATISAKALLLLIARQSPGMNPIAAERLLPSAPSLPVEFAG
jgi:hypothetical protein